MSDRYKMQVKVEVGYHNTDHDVFITYNGNQWSGLTARSLEDLEKIYYTIGEYLQEHDNETET
jgi:hypothetical protein